VSVVTQQARRRWAAVAAGIAVLLCLPVATAAATALVRGLSGDESPVPSASVLMRRALASAQVPHSGLARSTGSLGLPDLPQFSDVAAVLGGTTRTRVWWAGPRSWRVDVLTSTGEQGIYGDDDRTVVWDYERSRLTEVTGTVPVRLPRADDLLPPQAARRLLATVGPQDRLQVRPGRRSIAGIRAEGLRIVPGDRRSTIGHIDVWLDPDHGLPVAIEVVDARGVTALRSAFTDLDLTAPAASTLQVPSAPGAIHENTDAPDLVSRLQRFSRSWLPGRLAGVPASEPIVGGAATYGTGLVRFVVLPLPTRLGDQVIDAVRSGGGTDLQLRFGTGVLLERGLVNLVVVELADPIGQAYLVVGLADQQLLKDVAAELVRMAGGWPQ
jgi:hypothetical protein